MKPLLSLIFSLQTIMLLTSSCTPEYTAELTLRTLSTVRLASKHQVQRNRLWSLHTNTPIFLAGPLDRYNTKNARHLVALHSALDRNLQQVFANYSVSPAVHNLEDAIVAARRQRSELLLLPVFLSSTNKLNTRREIIEGSGVRHDRSYGADRVLFQVQLYEVRTGELLDVATVTSRSRMLEKNEALPQDLFERAAREYVKSISGRM